MDRSEIDDEWIEDDTEPQANEFEEEVWIDEEEEAVKKAAGPYYVPEKTPEELKNMTLQEKMEWNSDFKRMSDYLLAKGFSKGAASGLTFGLSEIIPGFKSQPGEVGHAAGEIFGSVLPLHAATSAISKGAKLLAQKSPYLKKTVEASTKLLGLGGLGAIEEAGHKIGHGELPTEEDLLTHGALWITLDLGLSALGKTTKFAKLLGEYAFNLGVPEKQLLDQMSTIAKESGVDLTQPERVADLFMDLISNAPKLSSDVKPLGKLRSIEQEAIEAATPNQLRELAKSGILEPGAENAALRNLPETLKEQIQMNEFLRLAEEARVPAAEPSIESAQEAIKPRQITGTDLKEKFIEPGPIDNLTKDAINLSEPMQPKVTSFSEEAADRSFLKKRIERSGEQAGSKRELGGRVQADVNENLKKAKAEYAPLYDEAETAAEKTFTTAKNTGREAGNKLKKIEPPKTKPAGYDATINSMENALNDAGFVVERDAEKAITGIYAEGEVPVSNLIELGRRLNDIINYDTVIPNIKDALKGVVKAVKEDIRIGLRSNPDALAAFELAEEAHANVARKFGKVQKLRETDAGERIAKQITEPTTYNNLKDVLTPEQMRSVNREFLEDLNKLSYEKGKERLREFEKALSANDRQLAKDIVESKNPYSTANKRRIAQEGVMDELATSFAEGTRPEKSLKLWQTEKGRKIIEDAMWDSPNWPKVKNYLKQQSFNDLAKSVLKKDGTLDLSKFNSFMQKPGVVQNIRDVGGEEAVKFFLNLEENTLKFQRKMDLLNRLPNSHEAKYGKELLERSKQKNIATFEAEAAAEQAAIKKKAEIPEKIKRIQEEKTTPKFGHEKIKKKSEKNLAQSKAKKEKKLAEEEAKKQRELIGPKAIESSVRHAKESSNELGDRILKRMAEKDFPVQAKVNTFLNWFKDTMGINAQGAMTVFGLAKMGLASPIIALIAVRSLNKMATNPNVRRAFKSALKQQNDPLAFLLAIEVLGQTLEENH